MNIENIHTDLKIKFLSNLAAAGLSGLTAGAVIGMVLGLKVARINPSITLFSQTWTLTTHLMVIYALGGLALGIVMGLLFYPFLLRKKPKAARSLYNIYLPAAFIIALFHYLRQYALTHFIANPLAPVKGSLWMNIGFTIFIIALAYFIVRLAVRLVSRLNLGRTAGFGGAALILVWAGLGIFCPGAKEAPAAAFQDYNPNPTRVKIALIGIDGAWWKVIDDLTPEGKLPNIQRLLENGVRGELKTLYPTFSAMIWTSIATGKLPQKHGINSFLVWSFPLTGVNIPMFRLPLLAPELLWIQENIATVAPIPSNYRRAEALWSVLSDKDIEVGVMNWWATWPAEPVNGYIYTDRALFNKLQVLTNYSEREGASIYDIHPPELILELQPFAYTPDDITREDLERFINVESDAFWDEFRLLDTYDYLDIAYEASMFKFSFPGDKTLVEAAKYMLDKPSFEGLSSRPRTTKHENSGLADQRYRYYQSNKGQPDFWAIYLQGLDSMSHQYLKYYFARENEKKLIPVNLSRYRNLVENYYIYMDETIGEFLARLDPNTIVMVVSDHGFDEEMLPTGHYHHIQPSHPGESEEFHINYEKHPGIFIACGPGIKTGAVVDSVTVLDIAPTILAVMGFPWAEDMDGEPLRDIFTTPLEYDTIATYDRPRAHDNSIIGTEVDKEVRDKLKALGYVK